MKNQLESDFLAKNCFETLRLIGPHLDDPPEAAAMTTSSSSSYKILKAMKSMEDQAKNDDQHGNGGKKFQMGQTAAGEAVPEKKCSSKFIHGMMKNANVYPKEG